MKILIAEDDHVSSRRLEEILTKWGYEVISCSTGTQAWEILKGSDAPMLAILDWIIPGMDGLELCHRIRNRIEEPYIYIILLTAKDEKKDVIKGMKAGVDDYITKPFYKHELEVRLRAGKRIIELQTELIAARDAFKIKATYDTLTGIRNRAAIIDRAEEEIDRAKRNKTDLTILMIDIDHFKHINDNYGHSIGDIVLCETVNRLRLKLRPYDGIGRFGGEEFLVVLPGCGSDVAPTIAERLRTAICEKPVNTNEGMMQTSISIGAYVPDSLEGISLESIIRVADESLYEAKKSGRNCFKMAEVKNA